jgi:hypothetical protein
MDSGLAASRRPGMTAAQIFTAFVFSPDLRHDLRPFLRHGPVAFEGDGA